MPSNILPPRKNIKVKVTANKKFMSFEVKDEGQGFSPEDKAKAFGRFARLSARPTGGESSTGLGLSIVKTLTELHGGTVEIESEGKERGSKMVVRIPNLYRKNTANKGPAGKGRGDKRKSGFSVNS